MMEKHIPNCRFGQHMGASPVQVGFFGKRVTFCISQIQERESKALPLRQFRFRLQARFRARIRIRVRLGIWYGIHRRARKGLHFLNNKEFPSSR
ncbi:hypothetical protein V6N13_002768 [Hibiscus sabdariffa]|uniref:Uncharacterized protein n=1 Tax=Hibiscus sabdariffa TaxID=183260 RepID=A0ABR2NY97_9ROSI